MNAGHIDDQNIHAVIIGTAAFGFAFLDTACEQNYKVLCPNYFRWKDKAAEVPTIVLLHLSARQRPAGFIRNCYTADV